MKLKSLPYSNYMKHFLKDKQPRIRHHICEIGKFCTALYGFFFTFPYSSCNRLREQRGRKELNDRGKRSSLLARIKTRNCILNRTTAWEKMPPKPRPTSLSSPLYRRLLNSTQRAKAAAEAFPRSRSSKINPVTHRRGNKGQGAPARPPAPSSGSAGNFLFPAPAQEGSEDSRSLSGHWQAGGAGRTGSGHAGPGLGPAPAPLPSPRRPPSSPQSRVGGDGAPAELRRACCPLPERLLRVSPALLPYSSTGPNSGSG